MRAVRVLRCKVCGTLWREPLPSGRALADAPPASGRPTADDASAPPAAADDAVPAVELVPVRDRRKTSDRRRVGYGGRRREDVKRPSALSRKPRREDPGKKPRS
jgi:hypothetical protein